MSIDPLFASSIIVVIPVRYESVCALFILKAILYTEAR
jgi:hypothetical protein